MAKCNGNFLVCIRNSKHPSVSDHVQSTPLNVPRLLQIKRTNIIPLLTLPMKTREISPKSVTDLPLGNFLSHVVWTKGGLLRVGRGISPLFLIVVWLNDQKRLQESGILESKCQSSRFKFRGNILVKLLLIQCDK